MTHRTLAEIARLCDADLEGDGSRVVRGPASLREATPEDVSFLGDPRYTGQVQGTRAAGVLVPRDYERTRDDLTLLRCDEPSRAFTQVVGLFARVAERPAPGVHPTAFVHEEARLGEGVSVGPHCVVAAGCEVGEGTVLHPHVVLGQGVVLGARCELHAACVLYPFVVVGDDGIVHSGSVLGSPGFGYEPSAEGWKPVPQTGVVELGAAVEIGANCALDRARFGTTRLGDGVKLDNLVHIGHNATVGDHSLLAAQVGLAGSSHLAERVVLAGQVGVNGHTKIGPNSQVGGKGAVFTDLPGDQKYLGYPAVEVKEGMRNLHALRTIGELSRTVKRLEKRLAELEAAAGEERP